MGQRKETQTPANTLKGQSVGNFDSLPDTSTNTYARLKEALLNRLSPDTEEDRQSARYELGRRKLRESQESINELARDIEKLLDTASPGLPEANRQAELRYHLLNSLPDKVALQLKLLPKVEAIMIPYQRPGNCCCFSVVLTCQLPMSIIC